MSQGEECHKERDVTRRGMLQGEGCHKERDVIRRGMS